MPPNSTPLKVDDFYTYASKILPRHALDYYRGGAGLEKSLRLNKTAYESWRLRPRMLRDIRGRDTSTTILGQKINAPIGIAPTAMQCMAHSAGETANAQAAANKNIIFCLSTLSTTSLEDVASATPNGLRWFQLYIYKDRQATKDLVLRASKCGYKALVLTVDAPLFGARHRDHRNAFSLPNHLSLANFTGIKASGVSSNIAGSSLNAYIASQLDDCVTWSDLKWLASITDLPIVVKGILTAEDALLSVQNGAAAVWVSNHGGRQLDGVPAPIEVLSEIVTALKGTTAEVYIDGGISSGTQILIALALGAKMVFLGRPALWALAYDGQHGVELLLDILRKEFLLGMALMGCSHIEEITRDYVTHQSAYSKY